MSESYSSNQIMKDVAYLENAILENYPYLEVHKRNGFDWENEIKKIPIQNEPLSDQKDLINYFSKYLIGLNGHVVFINNDMYQYYRNGYSSILTDHPEYKAWVDVLTNKKTLQTYKDSNRKTKVLPNNVNKQEKDLFELKKNGNYLYVKIGTFDMAYEDSEGKKIKDFLTSNTNSNSVIIYDIRGNGGGSDQFWQNALVKPFIETNYSESIYSIFKGGNISIPYLKAENVKLINIKQFKGNYAYLDDLKNFKYYSLGTQTVEPSGEKLKYKRIIVIMDESNFSASEGFVFFCKSTKFATLIGQNSSGDGAGFDPILVQLPNTGLIFTIPISAGINADGYLDYEKGTKPDIELSKDIDPIKYIYSNE